MKHLVLLVLISSLLSGCTSQAPPQRDAAVVPEGIDIIQRLTELSPNPLNVHATGQILDLEQTINDITVTVHWVYADAEQVLIGYMVRSADGRQHEPRHVTLITSNGQSFPLEGGIGLVGHSDVLGLTLPPGQSANLPQFDMIQQIDTKTPTPVRFTLETEEWLLPPPKPPTLWDQLRDFFQREQQEPQEDAQVIAQPIPVGRKTGPFIFEFVLPPVR